MVQTLAVRVDEARKVLLECSGKNQIMILAWRKLHGKMQLMQVVVVLEVC